MIVSLIVACLFLTVCLTVSYLPVFGRLSSCLSVFDRLSSCLSVFGRLSNSCLFLIVSLVVGLFLIVSLVVCLFFIVSLVVCLCLIVAFVACRCLSLFLCLFVSLSLSIRFAVSLSVCLSFFMIPSVYLSGCYLALSPKRALSLSLPPPPTPALHFHQSVNQKRSRLYPTIKWIYTKCPSAINNIRLYNYVLITLGIRSWIGWVETCRHLHVKYVYFCSADNPAPPPVPASLSAVSILSYIYFQAAKACWHNYAFFLLKR